ncbi:MAG: TetR/AcrR family transcriptional regulator, partial [Lentisphaeria bacterium]|nr:TetR/AcrR family transcriptional regulator [Lentisphaeria bacterium]
MAGGLTMQKRAIETRSKILSAAVELFAAGGMNGTSVDLIAATAGVNKQRIYAYFGSKEKLFIAALTSVFKAAEPFSLSMLEEAEKHPENLTAVLLENFYKLHEKTPCFW